jgi:hypothetical protein
MARPIFTEDTFYVLNEESAQAYWEAYSPYFRHTWLIVPLKRWYEKVEQEFTIYVFQYMDYKLTQKYVTVDEINELREAVTRLNERGINVTKAI